MTKKIYNLIFFGKETGLRYIQIDDLKAKTVKFAKNSINCERYHLEEIDNLTSFYSEEELKKGLNIEEEGYFVVISKVNNTFHKRHVLFLDENISYITDSILDGDDPKILQIGTILDDIDFLEYINKNFLFYNVSYRDDVLYLIRNFSRKESPRREEIEELRYLKKSFIKGLSTYSKYRDFYAAYRDFEDKKFISKTDPKKLQIEYKRKEEELKELEENCLFENMDKETYQRVKESILEKIKEIDFQSDELEKSKKRIIKKH